MMEIALEKSKVVPSLKEQDLNVHMSFGFVVRSRFGSLVALRAELEKLFDTSFTYPTMSSSPLFVVHWNDLNETKKSEIEKNTGKNKRR